jgi:ribosomal protein S18 acetylase RimI-like enzyme
MTADYAEAVRKYRFDLLYSQGTRAALIETIPRSDHLLIENVAVSPLFQGRGLGRNDGARRKGGGVIGSPRN